MREKAELLRLESGLSARHVSESADAAAAAEDDDAAEALPASEDAAPDGPLVRLADAPDETAVAGTATPSLSPGVQRTDEVVPEVQGDAAAQAARIDGYLASKFSPLTGLGAVFVTESQAVGMDPRFLVAISGAETSFGTYGPSQGIHNPFGMGPGIYYASWAEGIRAAAQNLGGPLYLGDGRVTIVAIRDRWAPASAANDPTGLNSNWVRNVSTYLTELGGDPAGSVFPGPRRPRPGGRHGARGRRERGRARRLRAGGPGSAARARAPRPPSRPSRCSAPPAVARGDDPERGFSAAGLVTWAYAEHGVVAPRTLAAQATTGRGIAPRDLDSGDVILFADASGGSSPPGSTWAAASSCTRPSQATGAARPRSTSPTMPRATRGRAATDRRRPGGRGRSSARLVSHDCR